jgi:predicted nucleic acid-binding Zn ribbon protein
MSQYLKQQSEYKMSEAIAEFLDKYRLKDGYTRMRIATIWEETMGKLIARHTKQIELKGNKLVLYITSPIVKKELMMLRSDIVVQLNKKIGKELITEIEIK